MKIIKTAIINDTKYGLGNDGVIYYYDAEFKEWNASSTAGFE